jgi:hypothetical protein
MVNKLWVVTSYKTDFSWIDNYTSNYIIYDKSGELQETDRIKHQVNVGYNIYDLCYFIIKHYDNLPDVCVFIKSNVFKHCNEDKFNILIQNNNFTPIESYEHLPVSEVHVKGADGGFMEINNSWYIQSHINSHGKEVNRFLRTYNQFLRKVFNNPVYPDWVRFAPGGNYIVPKENILFYSKEFYKRLMSYVDYHQIPSEAHIIERALYTIFTNQFQEKSQMMALSDDIMYWFIDSGKEFFGDVLHWLLSSGKKIYRKYLPDSIIRIIQRIRNGISR